MILLVTKEKSACKLAAKPGGRNDKCSFTSKTRLDPCQPCQTPPADMEDHVVDVLEGCILRYFS